MVTGQHIMYHTQARHDQMNYIQSVCLSHLIFLLHIVATFPQTKRSTYLKKRCAEENATLLSNIIYSLLSFSFKF